MKAAHTQELSKLRADVDSAVRARQQLEGEVGVLRQEAAAKAREAAAEADKVLCLLLLLLLLFLFTGIVSTLSQEQVCS